MALNVVWGIHKAKKRKKKVVSFLFLLFGGGSLSSVRSSSGPKNTLFLLLFFSLFFLVRLKMHLSSAFPCVWCSAPFARQWHLHVYCTCVCFDLLRK